MLIQDGCLERVENADIIDGVFVIPDRVQEIPDWAFQKCRSPRKIVFSARVSYSAGFYWPFAHCRQLEHIEVDERNPVFCAEGGQGKDQSVLLSHEVVWQSLPHSGYGNAH